MVDDGSTDATTSIVEEWMERYSHLYLIRNTANRGKGHSVRNGVLQAACDIVMFTDADPSAPMVEAERLIAALEAGADVAIGSPLVGASSPNHAATFVPAIIWPMLQRCNSYRNGVAI